MTEPTTPCAPRHDLYDYCPECRPGECARCGFGRFEHYWNWCPVCGGQLLPALDEDGLLVTDDLPPTTSPTPPTPTTTPTTGKDDAP